MANQKTASQWGSVVSIWPLGRRLHYAWPRDRDEFWQEGATGSADELVIDTGLPRALRLGREILFSTDDGTPYVAIDASFDAELRRRLTEWIMN